MLEGFEVIASYLLPNRTILRLGSGPPPESVDALVTSSDDVGTPGELNRYVLGLVGLEPEVLQPFKPPAMWIVTGSKPVLVVATVGYGGGDALELLLSGLGYGLTSGLLELNRQGVSAPQRLWIPLLGTGAGGLLPVVSARAIAEVVSRPQAVATEVFLSAPEPDAAELVRAGLEREGPGQLQPLGGEDLVEQGWSFEEHVGDALSLAHELAGEGATEAWHVLAGCVEQANDTDAGRESEAFQTLARILPLEVPDTAYPVGPALHRLSTTLRATLHTVMSTLGTDRIWGRHLVTAALLAPTTEGFKHQLATLRLGAADVRDAWYAFLHAGPVTKAGPQFDWDAVWRATGHPLPSEREARAGYHPEATGGADRLGIDSEAEALARLAIDEDVRPPLCIGLLGDWGSGKSFFMQRMQDKVAALHGGPGLSGKVVQINVNAWHLSDSHLWANLVPLVFEGIWKELFGEDSTAEDRQQVEDQLKEAHGALGEAELASELAEGMLERAQAEWDHHLQMLAVTKVVSPQLNALLTRTAEALGWSAPLASIIEVEAALKDTASLGRRGRLVLEAALEPGPLKAALALG